MKYDPHLIEKTWQKFWKENKTFKAAEDPAKPKYYVLDMFPYPSGTGLHVGHLLGYTATDVMARYKWAKGFSVLHPMGWDSFGLPAEQYAVRTGTHPAITTHKNIKNFKSQLNRLGYAYDWDREITTSEPDYYKWTQWIFTKLYEKGLAYQAEMYVNYCPALGTVLANEEVENGQSKEGGHPVERRPLLQWVMKITEYADRLLEDLKLVDWPEGLKKLQENWIGRSEGAIIDFRVHQSENVVSVFTTCPQTIFGATHLILSPEHPLVPLITDPGHREDVELYKRAAAAKSDLERAELAKAKTGVFTGAYAINPATQDRIPIWIADYVLISYGTGAIMAVPAHDERDFEFAKQFKLPIRPVVLPDDENQRDDVLATEVCWTKGGTCINSQSETFSLDGLDYETAKRITIDWLKKQKLGEERINYKLRDWLFSRQRYWGEPIPILHLEDGSMRPLELDELPLLPPEIEEYKPSSTGESPLANVKDWVEIVDPKTGKRARRETNTMPQWAGSCWYYLRFCDPNNTQKAWDPTKEKYWMPVDLYIGGAEHAVLHLLYSRFWHKVLYDCGLVGTIEPFQKLCNQGLIVSRSFQRSDGNYVPSNEVVERDGKYYHWETGEELRSQIEKMSKSKLNGVSPDEIIEEYGADALRLYSMFMGPIDKEKVWNTDAVSGCRRFLNRFVEMATSEKIRDVEHEAGLKLAHRLVMQVSQDIENMHFNTAVSTMMEFLNDFTKLEVYSKKAVTMAVQVLAPFAPHVAEDLWDQLGYAPSIAHASWPAIDPKYIVQNMVTYIVQVNGKLRGSFELPKNKSQEEILKLAQSSPAIAKHLTGEIVKVIFVPDRLINLVIR